MWVGVVVILDILQDKLKPADADTRVADNFKFQKKIRDSLVNY